MLQSDRVAICFRIGRVTRKAGMQAFWPVYKRSLVPYSRLLIKDCFSLKVAKRNPAGQSLIQSLLESFEHNLS